MAATVVGGFVMAPNDIAGMVRDIWQTDGGLRAMAERVIVRSYRRVFRIDRRIYWVDWWVLPIPGGVPLRGGVTAAALALVLVASALPALAALVGALSPPLRYVVVPLAVAVLAMQAAPDGRRRTASRPTGCGCDRGRDGARPVGRVPLEGEPVAWAGTVATLGRARPGAYAARVRGSVWVTFAVPVELDHGRRGRLVARGERRGGAVTRWCWARARCWRCGHDRCRCGTCTRTSWSGAATRAALFRMGTVSYPFLSAADKREWLRRLARLAFSLEADVSLWRVNRGYPAEDYVAEAAALVDEGRQDPAVWTAYLGKPGGASAPVEIVMPEVYLAVSLRPAGRSGFGDGVMRGVDRARRRLEPCSGSPRCRRSRPRAGGADRRGGARVPPRGGVSAAAARDDPGDSVAAAARGVPRPGAALDPHWQPPRWWSRRRTAGWRMSRWSASWCGTRTRRSSNATAHCGRRPEGRSFQAMLALGALPEEAEFPGSAELVRPLEAVEFPVDCVLHARWIGNREAISRVRRRIVDADVAYSEQLVSAHGPLSFRGRGEPAARARARRLPAVARASAAAWLRDLARGRRPVGGRARAAGRAARAPVRDGQPVPAPGLQPALFLDHLRARTAARCATTPTF